jgi:hypothetical protein
MGRAPGITRSQATAGRVALDATINDACTFLHPATRYVLPEHFASPTLVTEAGQKFR